MRTDGDLGSEEQAFIKTLIFSMLKILSETDKDIFTISAARYGRIINGIKNGSRETLQYIDIRAYTYHLVLIRRHWPQGDRSGWICEDISGRTHMMLEFRRVEI